LENLRHVNSKSLEKIIENKKEKLNANVNVNSNANMNVNSNANVNNARVSSEKDVSPNHLNGYYYLNSLKKKIQIPDYIKNIKYDVYKNYLINNNNNNNIHNNIHNNLHINNNLHNNNSNLNNNSEINKLNNQRHYDEYSNKRKIITRNILTGKERKDHNMKEREKELLASKNKIIERIQSGKPALSKIIHKNINYSNNNNNINSNSKEREVQKIQKRALIENYLSNGNSKKFQNIPTINMTKDGILIANKNRVISANPSLSKNKYL